MLVVYDVLVVDAVVAVRVRGRVDVVVTIDVSGDASAVEDVAEVTALEVSGGRWASEGEEVVEEVIVLVEEGVVLVEVAFVEVVGVVWAIVVVLVVDDVEVVVGRVAVVLELAGGSETGGGRAAGPTKGIGEPVDDPKMTR